mmetsp:Transcript_54111/g.173527  ORF Transcript_54111/g.173527 Transcript_54111/m.173527 type:complete len:255 (+) Transcript_54111:304-1068(+)
MAATQQAVSDPLPQDAALPFLQQRQLLERRAVHLRPRGWRRVAEAGPDQDLDLQALDEEAVPHGLQRVQLRARHLGVATTAAGAPGAGGWYRVFQPVRDCRAGVAATAGPRGASTTAAAARRREGARGEGGAEGTASAVAVAGGVAGATPAAAAKAGQHSPQHHGTSPRPGRAVLGRPSDTRRAAGSRAEPVGRRSFPRVERLPERLQRRQRAPGAQRAAAGASPHSCAGDPRHAPAAGRAGGAFAAPRAGGPP